jgi:hypothetical protein
VTRTRLHFLLVGLLLLASALGATEASAAPGTYNFGACGDGQGFDGRKWERAGQNTWSIKMNDCDVWLDQAPTPVIGSVGPGTATLIIGPGTLDELVATLSGDNGATRGLVHQFSVCGPGGWPSDCGPALTAQTTDPPGGKEHPLTNGEDFPEDADRIVLSAVCLQTMCDPGAPLKLVGVRSRLTDSTPPSLSVDTPSGWLKADSTLSIQGQDDESGIDYIKFAANTYWIDRGICTEFVSHPTNLDDAWQCDSSYAGDQAVPVPVLQQGPNTLDVQLFNGADLGSVHRLVTVRYDSSKPGVPTGVNFGQNIGGWAIGKDLIVRWTNPTETVENEWQSGVVRAELDVDAIEDTNGDPIHVVVNGQNANTAKLDLQDFGARDAHLTVYDGAGNSNTKHFQIKNDSAEVATPSIPVIAPINKAMADAGVTFNWTAAAPLSLMCGYRAGLDQNPGTDFGGVDPTRPFTTNTNSWRLTPDALKQYNEGKFYLHVQSGACSDAVSGMAHRDVTIDRVAPTVTVLPVPQAGWLTNDGSVKLTVEDTNSELIPKLTWSLGGIQHTSTSKDTTIAVPSGRHQLVFHATDAAGNSSLEQSISLGTDPGPPAVSLLRPVATDPSGITATLNDPDSGVTEAWIEIGPIGGATRRIGGRFQSDVGVQAPVRLSANVPDDGTFPDGDYVLKVIGKDASGRTVTATTWSDGTAAILRFPLRARPQLTAGLATPKGGAAPGVRTFDFGARARLVGTLRDPAGAPLAGEPLTVAAEYDDGGAQALGSVLTGADGSYALALGADISRSIVVRYAGSTVRAPTSATATQSFRTGVTLSARRVAGGILLRGRVSPLSASIPDEGLRIELALCPAGKCTTFGTTTRTDSDGGFSKRWPTAKSKRHKTFRFRAQVRRSGGWPFAAGFSQIVTLKGKK